MQQDLRRPSQRLCAAERLGRAHEPRAVSRVHGAERAGDEGGGEGREARADGGGSRGVRGAA